MSDMKALEQQLKDAKELIERRDNALQLGQNPLFKKMILEDFCTTEAARLVGQSADPALDTKQQADALSMAQAAGHLKRYLQVMVQMGNIAERDMPQILDTIEEVRASGEDD